MKVFRCVSKSIRVILLMIIVMAYITGCGSKEKSKTESELQKDEKIICGTLEEFKQVSGEKKPCILPKQNVGSGVVEGDVIYDGEMYYVSGKEERYMYIVDLTGRLPAAEADTRVVVLANENYSWEDYMWYHYRNPLGNKEKYNTYDDEIWWLDITERILVKSVTE